MLKKIAAIAAAWAGLHGCLAAGLPGGALAEGLRQCDQGHYSLAVDTLTDAYRQRPTGEEHFAAAAALGRAHMQLRNPALARGFLREAFEGAADPRQRARHGLDLANLEARLRNPGEAQQLYAAVLLLAPDDAHIRASVALNRIPLAATAQRLALLEAASRQLGALPPTADRATFSMNLGLQAKAEGSAPQARQLAYEAFASALDTARQLGDARLAAAARNQLAQLYEEQGRAGEALLLTMQAIVGAQAPEARDLLIELEWRRGRLLAGQGKLAPAIGAYQRAVDQIEAVRQDIPVEYENGRSSFRDTLEPVYLGLADLLLQQVGALDARDQGRQLRRVRDTLGLIKQTELEDFLGSRCAVEGLRPLTKAAAASAPVPPGTAVLFPVLLADRVELLVETSAGIERRSSPTTPAALRRAATEFATALRNRAPYLALAQRLHGALLAPAAGLFERDGIHTVVVVPDSVLRLVPFGALHDGQRFAIEKYAIAVVPAVTLDDSKPGRVDRRPIKLLLAGVSQPGAVVDRLPDFITEQLLALPGSPAPAGAERARTLLTGALTARNLVAVETPDASAQPKSSSVASAVADQAARQRTLQDRLALAGVAQELARLGKLAPSTTLLNQDFSVRAFSAEVRGGDYRVVHIASHGVFGATANATFIMAHDDLITIDQLQGTLGGQQLRDHPIDLLTLSACQTAEGDDRAPLGLSGAALKAQARSALGSLWPVSDDAATLLMADFYRHLVSAGIHDRARALQRAQTQMIGQAALRHPYFWAPFILVERRL